MRPDQIYEDDQNPDLRWPHYFEEELPPLNLPLVRETWDFVRGEAAARAKVAELLGADVAIWEQTQYFVRWRNGTCGTACCFAGAAIALAGHQPEWLSDRGINSKLLAEYAPAVYAFVGDGAQNVVLSASLNDVRRTFVSGVARDELGLTLSEGEALFWLTNSPDHIRMLLLQAAAKRGVDLELEPA